MTLEDWLTTLGPLWAAWEARGRALPAEQWQATNTAWRLDGADAVRPRGRMAVRVLHLVGQVREVAATHASAAGLLGDFKRPAGIATSEADRVAAAAREDAATYTPAQMIEQFAVTGPHAIATAR